MHGPVSPAAAAGPAATASVGGRPPVTVVVVTHRGADLLPSCLAGLRAQTYPHRLVMIDNASADGTAGVLAAQVSGSDGRVVRLPENTGFAGGVAAALPLVQTRFVALLNDDAVPDPDWLERLVAVAETDDDAAAWTSLMLLAERPAVVNNLGTALDEHWYGVDVAAGADAAHVRDDVRDVFGFSGGAALLRTAAVRAVGGVPAEFFLYYEDLDTSWRLRLAGWHIRAVPAARVRHRHAASSNRRSDLFHFHNERNRLLTLIRCAPAYVAPVQFGRFLVTTASLAGKRLARRPVPDEPNFRTGLRLRVVRAVLAAAPRQYWLRPRRRLAKPVPRPADAAERR